MTHDQMHVFVIGIHGKEWQMTAIGRFIIRGQAVAVRERVHVAAFCLIVDAIDVNELVEASAQTIRRAQVDATHEPVLKHETHANEQNVPAVAHGDDHD